MHRASLRVPRQGAHARAGAGDPGASRRVPAGRHTPRLRSVLPKIRARARRGPGRARRAAQAHRARAVRGVKWLTRGGAAGALAVGAAVTAGLGWRGLILLLAFFVSGSVLTQVAGGEGGQRNLRQVVANGGVAAAAALWGRWSIAAAALAAATADTWATEIGAFSPTLPRLLTTGRQAPKGTSGAMSVLGAGGGVVGAWAIALLAWVLEPRGPLAAVGAGSALGSAVAIAGAGAAGMVVDSLLGATLQGVYECP